MRSKAIFMALLALAYGAQARPVSVNDAKAAACAWAKAGRHLSAWIGTQSDTVLTRTTAGGATFHVVRMAGGGTVITSGDTEVEPIVAFTSEQVTEEALDPKGPLYALLKRDLEIRHQVAPSTGLAFGPTAYAAKRAASATVNERKWSALIAAGVERDPRLSFGLAAAPALPEISDLRVDALMRTKWSQGDGIWNYYTPPGKDRYTPDNAVCGCVATATAQVMRYLHGTPDEDGAGGLEIPFPLASVEQKTFTCQYKGNDIDLTMQGGTYAWDDMPFTKAEIETAVQKQNIGKLTSDVGISVNMWYDEPSGAGSGATYANAAKSLVETFGYRQSSWVILGDSDIDSEDSMGIEGSLLFANFDARRPCMVGIPGHAIVADGYGYDGDLPYTHLNMGWAGSGDMWYNLPDMTAAGDKYTVVQEIGYNVFPEIGGISEDGQTTHGILSGRVLDDDGNPVPGCAVAVRQEGGEVTNLVTDAAGIWAAILPAGKYDVEALTDDRQWIGVAENLVLEAPGVTATVAEPGNSWGNDITLEHPSVRLGAEIFSSIDRAVAAAREQAVAAPDETFVLEVLDNTWLKRTQTIDFRCAIVATNDDPYASVVTRRSFGSPKVDAAFEVATNGFLSIRNVVFAGSGKTLVSVASNGVAAVSGLVDFGVSYETAAIRTEAADGFMLAGELVRGFTLDCVAAPQEGQLFGFGQTLSVPVFEAITNTADRIANLYDPDGETRGYVVGGPNDYTLVWRKRPVPFEESVGYYIDKDGGTNTAGRIDRLFRDYEAALAAGRLGDVRKMVIRRDGALTRPLSVVDGLTLTGEGGAVVTVGPEAGFTLTGGDVSVGGIVFSNYTGNALFLVDGANLKIGAGTVFTDIRGTNRWSGAVTVLAGSATVGGGARFERCRTKEYANSCGGAIYLAPYCLLSLEGCTITNCQAQNFGGAVYAATGSCVSVTGELWVAGNKAGITKIVEEDIFLDFAKSTDARFLLTGPVEGLVGVRRKVTGGNADGYRFADAERAVDAHESADAFFCTVNGAVVAEAEDSPAGLHWTDEPVDPQPLPEERKGEASARVTYRDGTEEYYLLTYEALETVAGDATVEIIGWNGNYIKSDLEVKYDVMLKSDVDVGAYFFERRGDCSFKIGTGASLTLQDIDIRGCQMTNGVDEAGNPVLLRAKPDELTSVPVFDVCGGSLTLETPSDPLQYETEIAYVYGATNRNAGAVSVWKGGTFRIESGAVIRDCVNFHVNEGSGSGRGGAVLVDNGHAELFGGTITNCFANNGGGVFIGNGASVEVKGDMVIDGNFRLDGTTPSNLYVYDRGQMVLTDKLTGHVGYTEGVAADTEVFGRIDSSAVPADVRQSSAHNFTHDTDGDVGMAVSGPGGTNLLVWSSSLDAAGNYTDAAGTRYALVVGDDYRLAEGVPVHFDFTYNGGTQVGVPDRIGYDVSGTSSAVDAGTYTAKAKLRKGFVWSDGTSADKEIEWTIAKATYDMSGVTFDDASFPYDGLVHELTISGTLPDGVSVSYTDNARKEIGSQDATATFTGDFDNYEEIAPKTVTLTVFDSGLVDPPVPPETDPFTVDTNTPTPIAFSAITRKSDTEWELVVTDLVEQAEYALSYTPDLKTAFTTDTWFRATSGGAWTNTVVLPEAKPAYFWRAHGRTTYVTNWANAIPPQPQP